MTLKRRRTVGVIHASTGGQVAAVSIEASGVTPDGATAGADRPRSESESEEAQVFGFFGV